MPRRKQTKPGDHADADDPLFRALRQVAREALEEDIPERLLRLIRAAHSPSPGEGEPGEAPSSSPRKPAKPGKRRAR